MPRASRHRRRSGDPQDQGRHPRRRRRGLYRGDQRGRHRDAPHPGSAGDHARLPRAGDRQHPGGPDRQERPGPPAAPGQPGGGRHLRIQGRAGQPRPHQRGRVLRPAGRAAERAGVRADPQWRQPLLRRRSHRDPERGDPLHQPAEDPGRRRRPRGRRLHPDHHRGRHRAPPRPGRAEGGPGPGRGRQRGQERVPRQHEPRDPHAVERGAGPGRRAFAHGADRPAARHRRDDRQLRTGAHGHPQRRAGPGQGGVRAAGAVARELQPA